MKTHTLSASKRTIIGKQVKKLRKTGQMPATIYGKNLESLSVSIPLESFKSVYKHAGVTGLIELVVDGEKHPVLIHTVQVDPVSDAVLHVEFHQVDLKEKVHAKVPLQVTGVSPAVEQKLGVLLVVLNEVEVEALPTHLPEHIIVDVGSLTEVNQEFAVSHLHVPSDVTILTDSSLTLIKVGPLVTKEAEAQAAAEEAQSAEQSAVSAEAAPVGGDTSNAAPAQEPSAKSQGTEKK